MLSLTFAAAGLGWKPAPISGLQLARNAAHLQGLLQQGCGGSAGDDHQGAAIAAHQHIPQAERIGAVLIDQGGANGGWIGWIKQEIAAHLDQSQRSWLACISRLIAAADLQQAPLRLGKATITAQMQFF